MDLLLYFKSPLDKEVVNFLFRIEKVLYKMFLT